MSLNSHQAKKLQELEQWFGQKKGSIVAFSGGIDSSLVLFLARKYQGKLNTIGVISNSESLKAKDFNLAKDFCEKYDIHIEVIKTDEINDERYSQNPENRCFYCKEHLFSDLSSINEKYPEFVVLSGTNYDDLGDYRPGIQAAEKHNVLSPMVDCKLTKDDLRQIAKHFDLPNWDKPASPCLSSRVPYFQPITKKKLAQIEAAENILNDFGFVDVRMRHYGEYGQIEVQPKDMEKLLAKEKQIRNKISNLGFNEVRIDKEGLVSGKLNRALNTN